MGNLAELGWLVAGLRCSTAGQPCGHSPTHERTRKTDKIENRAHLSTPKKQQKPFPRTPSPGTTSWLCLRSALRELQGRT
ncbi:hypothetical protein IWZ03DRAFT_383581 [Phyllosticta citriasiana]|uniref:Secreted protein n=1 Tax=Phyllosticta citriasiana TaxID=595635 RepID=A0ABR1KG19_9PEZI